MLVEATNALGAAMASNPTDVVWNCPIQTCAAYMACGMGQNISFYGEEDRPRCETCGMTFEWRDILSSEEIATLDEALGLDLNDTETVN